MRGQLGIDIVALCGLALLGATGKPRADTELRSALDYCDRRLQEWVAEHPDPIIERPWVNAYVEGRHTNYVFLSPEIVIALYFLERRLPGEPLHYIWTVVDTVLGNVLRDGPGGLRVQGGLEGTVDQLWACRLLLAFRERFKSDDLLPAPRTNHALPTPRPTTMELARRDWRPLQALLAGLGGVGGYAALVAADASLLLTIPGSMVAALCSAMLGIVVKPWFTRLSGRHEDEASGRS